MFAQNLQSAYFLYLIQVSFHVVLWPVWLTWHNLYLCLQHVLQFLLVCTLISAGKCSQQYFPKFNNEKLRKTGIFSKLTMILNVSLSLRLFWWMQLYLNLFQHLSFHNLFHLVHGEVHSGVNTCTSYQHKECKTARHATFSWNCF